MSLLKLLFVVPFGTVTLIMLIEVIEWLITGGEPELHLTEPQGSSDMEVRHSIEDVEDKDQDTTHPDAGGWFSVTDGLLRSTIQAWTDWRLWYVLLAGASVAVTSWIIATKTGSFEGYWLLGYLGGFGTAVIVDWFSEQFQ